MNNSLHLTQVQDLQILKGFQDFPGMHSQRPRDL